MGEDGKIIYRVVINDSGVEQEAEAAGRKAGQGLSQGSEKHAGAFKEIWIGAMREIGAAAVNLAKQGVEALANLTKAAVDSVASMEQNVGGVETLFKDSADTVIANAKRAYETAGMSANEYMQNVTSFSASLLQSLGGDTVAAAEYADRAIIDMSDNANKMGTDISMIQNAYQGFAKQNYTMLDNLKLGYGGTKEEMQRLVAEAATMTEAQKELGVAVDASSLSFANIVNAISVVQLEMGIAGTTADEAAGTIEGSMNSAKAAYDNFLNGSISAEEFSDAIIRAANNIAKNLVTITSRFATELPKLVTELGRQLPEMITTIGPPLFNAVSGVIGSLLQLLWDNFPNMVNAGVELLVNMLEGFASSGATGKTMAAVMTIIRTLLNAIADNLPRILAAGVSILMQLLAGLGEALPTLVAYAGELILRLFNAFVSADWASIGHNIVQGVKNGIAGLWDSLVNQVQEAVNNLWNSAKRALGIASPSKKFKYIGEMSVEGTMEGFEDEEASLTRTVQDIYTGLGDTAQAALLPAMSTGSFERDISYNLSATGSMADMTIVVPLSLDGREIARATAWSMGQQLAWEEI